MTGTTTGGLVYPLASEPVRDGAARMQYFLEQLDQDPVEVEAISSSGSLNVPNAAWTKTQWSTRGYTYGNGFVMGPNGPQPNLAGRYYLEFAAIFPSGMNNSRRGIAVGLVSASQPDPQNVIMFGNFGDVTKDEQQSRIVTSMSLPASSAGQVTGWVWQQTGGTVVFDRTKMTLVVRRLRLGQSHA